MKFSAKSLMEGTSPTNIKLQETLRVSIMNDLKAAGIDEL